MTDSKTLSVPSYVEQWFLSLRPQTFVGAIPYAGNAAVFSADMIIGFCKKGNLYSQRVAALVGPVTELFERTHDHGVSHFVLLQDAHSKDTPEFNAYAPHCVKGSEESDTIPELKRLSFSGSFIIFQKNSINPAIATSFDAWLDLHPEIQTAIVVGNCTDLCVYNLAMHLRLRANALNNHAFQVVVPSSNVDTYDLPDKAAKAEGLMPHPGDFFHRVFLYHMALNGIQVVRELI